MIFGSWTYNENELTIKYLYGKRHVELNDYSPSGIWDLMEVPGQLIQKKSKIAYRIRIRRKTLFYTVILIIPTVLMAFLSMMVFYLPSESSEKITLAISILLALVVFLLLVSKILPPTSSTIPLMAKYLLTTFWYLFETDFLYQKSQYIAGLTIQFSYILNITDCII
jgi:nicotinic acetylcholine receptor